MISKMKTVAVFFGGVTPEHDISIVTAISSVIKPLELLKQYVVIPIYITKSGAWYSHPDFKNIQTFSTSRANDICSKERPLTVSFDGGLSIVKSGFKEKRIKIDIAFPAMHGGNGEDGSLMGLLRMTNIPFVGSDMPASVLAMDKLLAKQIAESQDISICDYVALRAFEFEANKQNALQEIEAKLHYPVFVKPTHLGSSIGISRATDRKSLEQAIEVALYYDEKIIIEQAVPNLIEVTVPIMGNDILEPALVEKPLSPEDEFFDFDTKYMHGGKKTGGAKQAGAQGYSQLPAELPEAMYNECVAVAESVYRAIECEGIARIDLLIDGKAKKIYFNEVNPLPGSLYAHNWRAAGVSGVELVSKLIGFAEQRYEKQAKLQKTFSTSFLKQF